VPLGLWEVESAEIIRRTFFSDGNCCVDVYMEGGGMVDWKTE